MKFAIPDSDTGCAVKFEQFVSGFTQYFDTLGYDEEDRDEIAAITDAYRDALENATAAKDAALSAVAVKNHQRLLAEQALRRLAASVKVNKAATPEILASMSIVPGAAAAGPPRAPKGLSASASAAGSCRLSWPKSGNARATTYIIEVKADESTWQWLGSTTKRSFVDPDATPGVPRQYRVRAQRAGTTTPPSPGAAIYSGRNGSKSKAAA